MSTVCVLGLSGCDMFRKIAGRPTSDEIAAKREKIEAIEQEAARQAELRAKIVQDSLQACVADSLEMVSEMAKGTVVVTQPKLLPDTERHTLAKRYYLVAGSFANADNAVRLAETIRTLGYEAVTVRYPSGTTQVLLCPSRTLVEAYRNLKNVRDEKFCPKDVWILDAGL